MTERDNILTLRDKKPGQDTGTTSRAHAPPYGGDVPLSRGTQDGTLQAGQDSLSGTGQPFALRATGSPVPQCSTWAEKQTVAIARRVLADPDANDERKAWARSVVGDAA